MLIFQDNCFRADVGGGERSPLSLDQEPVPKGRLNLIRNSLYAGSFLLIGNLPGQAFGDLFEVPPEVSVQRFFGLDRGHFRSPQVFGNGGEECGIKSLCRYLQRFSRLLS
jgi:hypothetical protein